MSEQCEQVGGPAVSRQPRKPLLKIVKSDRDVVMTIDQLKEYAERNAAPNVEQIFRAKGLLENRDFMKKVEDGYYRLRFKLGRSVEEAVLRITPMCSVECFKINASVCGVKICRNCFKNQTLKVALLEHFKRS